MCYVAGFHSSTHHRLYRLWSPFSNHNNHENQTNYYSNPLHQQRKPNPSSMLNSNLFLANADAYRSPEKGRKEPCNLHVKEGKFLVANHNQPKTKPNFRHDSNIYLDSRFGTHDRG
jgi:hypothetical protein